MSNIPSCELILLVIISIIKYTDWIAQDYRVDYIYGILLLFLSQRKEESHTHTRATLKVSRPAK